VTIVAVKIKKKHYRIVHTGIDPDLTCFSWMKGETLKAHGELYKENERRNNFDDHRHTEKICSAISETICFIKRVRAPIFDACCFHLRLRWFMVLCMFKWKNAINILKRYGSRHVAMLISIGVYRRCNLIFDAAFKTTKNLQIIRLE